MLCVKISTRTDFGKFSPMLKLYLLCDLLWPLTTKQTLASWRTFFWVCAGVMTFAVVVFAIFGSGEEQPWNDPERLQHAHSDSTTSKQRQAGTINVEDTMGSHVNRSYVDDTLKEQKRFWLIPESFESYVPCNSARNVTYITKCFWDYVFVRVPLLCANFSSFLQGASHTACGIQSEIRHWYRR